MTSTLVFFAMVVTDIVWAGWSSALAAKQELRASLYAAAITVCGGFTIVQYTDDHWLLVPATLGAFAGTWLKVRWETLDDDQPRP